VINPTRILKYDNYFELYPYPLSDFQKYAIEAIVEKQHVLVTAHTGSGKTLPAEFAIRHFVKNGKKSYLYESYKSLIQPKILRIHTKISGNFVRFNHRRY
jgi:superfamily II RNA helicase